MESPCEVSIECQGQAAAEALASLAQAEGMRIERKFSRHRDDNIVYRINHSRDGLEVDEETAHLIDFVNKSYYLSDGRFDVTSGILRRAWHFGKGARVPQQSELDPLLQHIGWHRVRWNRPQLGLPEGMEIDFDGIAREYAVDSALTRLVEQTDVPVMVKFGSACRASGPMENGSSWMTGIEDPHRKGDATAVIHLNQGALATSGDIHECLEQDGRRYSNILNPRTGWPNPDAPLSVTVASATCTEAVILSTLAMLQGADAENFLENQRVKHWCFR